MLNLTYHIFLKIFDIKVILLSLTHNNLNSYLIYIIYIIVTNIINIIVEIKNATKTLPINIKAADIAKIP